MKFSRPKVFLRLFAFLFLFSFCGAWNQTESLMCATTETHAQPGPNVLSWLRNSGYGGLKENGAPKRVALMGGVNLLE